ncbi:MAG: hypothetical protein ACP5OC_08090 [Thermoplasmata archaeon]
MTFRLSGLGPYRVERSEDYETDTDRSWGEIIRVRGSKPKPPFFTVPSHLYKYSESELALYLKDHKNLWRTLGKLLNQKIEISDVEIVLRFPVSRFEKVSQIVPFVKKRGSGKLSPGAIAMRNIINARRHTDKVRQNEPNLNETMPGHNNNPDLFLFEKNNRYLPYHFMTSFQGSGQTT